MALYLFQFRELYDEIHDSESWQVAPLLHDWSSRHAAILEPYRKFRKFNTLDNSYEVGREELECARNCCLIAVWFANPKPIWIIFGLTMMSRFGSKRRHYSNRAKFKGLFDFMIATCEWFGKNFAWNLNALPEDKLGWKPAPTANSTFEVTQHAAASLRNMQLALEGQSYGAGSPPMPTTREEAQELIIEAANAYADYLRGLTEMPQGEAELPWGKMPRARCLAMPVQDLVHHHGQIAYIQTLLGDTSDHFFEFEGG